MDTYMEMYENAWNFVWKSISYMDTYMGAYMDMHEHVWIHIWNNFPYMDPYMNMYEPYM